MADFVRITQSMAEQGLRRAACPGHAELRLFGGGSERGTVAQ